MAAKGSQAMVVARVEEGGGTRVEGSIWVVKQGRMKCVLHTLPFISLISFYLQV